MSNIRADKFLASCMGITRTEAKKAIRQKRFSSDSGIISNSDDKIESSLLYYFDKKPIQYEEFSYFLFHKPAGCVSATKDNLHKTVLDFMPKDYKELFPVGRLDIDTTGLMLITNDGQLAHDLLSPSKPCWSWNPSKPAAPKMNPFVIVPAKWLTISIAPTIPAFIMSPMLPII